MEVFITGVAGFIGSNLADRLLDKGFKVTGVDNFDNNYARSIKERNITKALKHPGFSFYEADITSQDPLSKVPFTEGVVIHLAAKTGVRLSIADPAGYIKTNITGTQNILDWMRARKLNKLIFTSSSSVYGNNKKTPFSEKDPVDNPISPYAFTKKSCELLNYSYHYLYGIDVLNTRFFTVFGERQRPDLAIYKFVKAILNGEPIEMFGEGDSSRDYTYVGDIVQGLESSIDFILRHQNVYEIINLGNSHPVSLRELVQIISKATGRVPQIKHLPKQAGDVERTFADISKAGELLKYHPATSLQSGIEKFVAWYKEEVKGRSA